MASSQTAALPEPCAGLTLGLPAASIPTDHARQLTAYAIAERCLKCALEGDVPPVILDLGCGNGNSVDWFRRASPGATWVGVDIAESPEVRVRCREDADFRTYDGVNIPIADNSVDLIFCKQAFTHVRHPAALLSDVRRVLKRTGQFVGSTSQLEPMVSYSRTNSTPYGFFSLLADAGLALREIRPGIDALTLILRRLFWMPGLFDRFYERESPLNRLIDLAGRCKRRSIQAINARKIMFAGQFGFMASPVDRGETSPVDDIRVCDMADCTGGLYIR